MRGTTFDIEIICVYGVIIGCCVTRAIGLGEEVWNVQLAVEFRRSGLECYLLETEIPVPEVRIIDF